MIPPFKAFLALLWATPDWQRYFADTVGEVRRSFLPLAIEFGMLVAFWLIVGGGDSGFGFTGILLQSMADLAATACFLTLFAVAALRFGFRSGLCRTIAAFNWVSLILAVMAQIMVGVSQLIDSQSLLLGSGAMLFIWLNVTLFRLMKQAMQLPTAGIVGALVLHILLALTFTQAAFSVQMRFDPPAALQSAS